MKKICVISYKLFDFNKKCFLIGGIQTYIRDLCIAFGKAGSDVIMIQVSEDEDNECFYKGFVIANKKFPNSSRHKSYQIVFDYIYAKYNSADTNFVVSTDQMGVRSKECNVFTIQHGIAFDIPGYMIPGLWGKFSILQSINKYLRCLKNIQRFHQTKNVVCVDYNYYNWLRTLDTISNENCVKIIPNYTSHAISPKSLEEKIKRNSRKRIIFARRFVDYRGTLLFANVIKRLLSEGVDIDVTFAGSGPLEKTIITMFEGFENVHFTSFSSDESIAFHEKYDISVVPTIFSEGTSLSLIESMAAGCFPIATHVGGMTNIILDGYNGKLTAPSENALYQTIIDVLSLPNEDFNEIVSHAYDTATKAFSYDNWCKKWLEVLS